MHKDAATSMQPEGYPAAFGFALAANLFFYFSFQTTFPVLPRFIAEVVVKRPPEAVGGQVGLATTVVALIAVLTRIPAGQLSDRSGRRRFMFLGAICFTVAPLFYGASRGMPSLLLGRTVHGLGLGIFATAFQALATELAPASRRGEALGLAGASVSVAFISAPLVGDWLAATWGYTLLFNVSAAAAAVSVVMVTLITAPPRYRSASLAAAATPSSANPQKQPSTGKSESIAMAGLRLALTQTGVRAGVLTMAALGIPFGAFITFLPLFADQQQIGGVGMVYSTYAATILLAQPLAGRLTDRLGRREAILPGLVITGLATGILALDSSLIMFALAGMVFGLGGGLVRGGIDPLVQDSVPPTLRGTAAAVQYTSFDFWIGLGSYPVGLLSNAAGYAAAFLSTGAVCLLGGGALAVMFRRTTMD